ncbi:dihydroorotase [Plantactinospora sp. KBS50]|uniref:dihydroorotase n=1 Tax=Plantactinospora sp. KBS50 TaxID=2024580 RepID=UPI000BAABB70|nr:dihydroorotase [Plantactinospora sp. KBS50]ASW57612.1 dihydroorotase [Plantactinospora sp. KBS50]
MTDAYLIKGVRVLDAEPTDLLVRDGTVREAGRGIAAAGATVLDADGLVALPGLVDLHTHLREPGREDAETVESGSRAAALGGYTAVCAMANTSPVADTAGVVEQVWRLGREAGLVDVQPIGAVTIGLAGEHLAELGAMAESAAAVRIFSDDGHCVADPRLMRRALEYVKAFGGIIAQHAEEPRLTEGAQMHEGEVATRLGLAGWPAVAEEAIIARDVLLAEHVGSRLHVCHVSTAGSVEVLRQAKARGVAVTAEVTPHHLLLTDELIAGGSPGGAYDPVYKVNPPLRTADDVAALRAALVEGVIDVVATDHAPHAVEDKECEWAYARPGMLGLETALSVALAVLGPDWELIAQRMSRTPARIAGLTGHGHDPAPGRPATFTLVDPAARRRIDPGELASRSRNTPYAAMELPGRIVATFLRGEPTVLDGKAVK